MNTQKTDTTYTTSNGVWNGWSWRFVGLTVLAVAVLQVILKLAMHYQLYASLPLAVLIVSYVIIPRVKERKLANAIVGVIATFIIGVILELALEMDLLQQAAASHMLTQFVLMNMGFPLVLGLLMSYMYLRLTQWSDKKRLQMEAKRRATNATTSSPPIRRHHQNKKRKKR